MSATATVPEVNEAIILDFLHAQAAGLRRELPDFSGLHLSVGTWGHGSPVIISGYLKSNPNKLRTFSGDSIANVAKAIHETSKL